MTTPTDGKTPDLSTDEQHEVEKNQPPRAAVLHEIIRTRAIRNLSAASPRCGGRRWPPA
jgi:hypothetical protein